MKEYLLGTFFDEELKMNEFIPTAPTTFPLSPSSETILKGSLNVPSRDFTLNHARDLTFRCGKPPYQKVFKLYRRRGCYVSVPRYWGMKTFGVYEDRTVLGTSPSPPPLHFFWVIFVRTRRELLTRS